MDTKSDSDIPIQFKPLTNGLGLNQFMDGLPYASVQQRRSVPQPVHFSPPRAPQKLEPMNATVATPAQTVTALLEPLHYAGFLRRMFAFCIDVCFVATVFTVIVWASFSLNGYDIRKLLMERPDIQFAGPFLLLYLVMHMGYFLIQEMTWQRTLGKALLGMRIKSISGFSLVGRVICFFIAALPIGIGLLWYFFDAKHRCWHDVITDSEVIVG